MKTSLSNILTLTFIFSVTTVLGQLKDSPENYGNTINAGVGLGYFKYVNYSVPVAYINFEKQIDDNLTVAPFIMMYSYNGSYESVDQSNVFKKYNYIEKVVPIGLKISYYFDELLKLNSNWDIYSSGSLGFIYRQTVWDKDYTGKKNIYPGTGPLYLDLHIGSEYHFSKLLGLQFDLSSGLSTIGMAIHF